MPWPEGNLLSIFQIYDVPFKSPIRVFKSRNIQKSIEVKVAHFQSHSEMVTLDLSEFRTKKERTFLNHWVIRRTLVCFVVSGHDINIKF